VSIVLDNFSQIILQHGSIALFVLLAVGIVGLPIPDETLLVFVGFLLARDKLPLVSTLVCAYIGSMCGISLSYVIGRLAGSWLIKRYGRWIGITPQRIERAHAWFQRIGAWTLPIGYFIPGVRHLTGYVAGTLQLNLRKFSLFAYSGAVIWVSTFIIIGYILPNPKSLSNFLINL
jgi:membrane protein DedA with SNARE-associated domain